RNSEESFDSTYKMKKSYQSIYADSVFAMSVGSVMGPVYENETYKLVKVTGKKSYPDSVKCRHILIKTGEKGQLTVEDSVAKNKIDSIAAAIKAGTPFAEMVQKYSDDEGSKEKGGEYTFSFEQKNNLSKEFGDFIFEGKKGESKVVKVSNNSYAGYHYIEILDQTNFAPALQLAVISKALFAGDETENEVYAKAAEFAGSNSKAAEFDNAIATENLQKLMADNIKVSDFTIQGIGPSREIVRWVYESEVGQVSGVFALPGKYLVAKLTAVNKAGLRTLDSNTRRNIEPQLKNEKKADVIAKKYDGKKSLSEIASTAGTELQSFDSFRGNNSFSGPMGYAPKVVGYSFCNDFKPNTVSPAIKEQSAVYFISVKNRYTSANKDETFSERERDMMQMEIKNSLNGRIEEQLKKNANIKYNPQNY
ncbi:MAG: peptidylprolyl isomerase, partial [Chitinophagaceae bacterium]|nr:peptidylprolyl isomerase [Chitinophagaceae bacterium]